MSQRINGNHADLSTSIELRDDKSYSAKLCKLKDNQNKTSNLETLMLIIKANIGTGILAIPFIFKNMGLALGPVFLLMIGFVCLHCMHIIVDCHDYVAKQRNEKEDSEVNENFLNYENIVYLVMKEKFGLNSNIPAVFKSITCLSSKFTKFNKLFQTKSIIMYTVK